MLDGWVYLVLSISSKYNLGNGEYVLRKEEKVHVWVDIWRII